MDARAAIVGQGTPLVDRWPAVWVVDDNPAVRVALERLLRATALAVETFASPKELLTRLEHARPSCLVVDLILPEFSGLRLLRFLNESAERIPVVLISAQGNVSDGVEAMKQGAIDFLEKPVEPGALLAAVMRGLAQDAEWSQARAREAQAARLLSTLTPREREVFGLVAKGKSNKGIAAELGTSEKTVKVHRGRVMRKLGAASVVDLVRLADQTLPSIPRGGRTAEAAHPAAAREQHHPPRVLSRGRKRGADATIPGTDRGPAAAVEAQQDRPAVTGN